ncbi:SMP-30/gluconolactonase/LRE family protein [Nitrosomonas sp. Is37]|uniref:SMP-30/gluconolactonase/LRE family protein n=1 Tax=Nitrosomonas sp. Is37 TaxID=3080535 RepID=UPI00294AE593|nr:SMP-30/gluconolactonase/LRE family protein [Nitrosomonas sp. Is37]MDV6343962.1 SMP-30/gluconolactonase/LRE family protein [Nitrosomonas sp. Is37]
MKTRNILIALPLLFWGALSIPAMADEFPRSATFSSLVTTDLNIEGLTGDDRGNLYTPTRPAGGDCAVLRFDSNIAIPLPVTVGRIPAPCAPLGLAFDHTGRLYVTEPNSGKIFSFLPDASTPPLATEFASGVPGANGVAFDRDDNLWVSDGTTGQGRVWKITPAGAVTEEFRIQPMANDAILDAANVGGVGRDVRTLPPGMITFTPAPPTAPHTATNTAGSQPLVANGLAFNKDGDLFVSDTARGALWKVKLDRHGNVQSRMNCDTTFTPNTLCLDNIFVAHPLLEGADGIALDRASNIWVDANERNAVIVVTSNGKVIEVFRNAPDTLTGLRNTGPLEFNTSPVLSDRRFCTVNLDAARRDNFPNDAGEIKPTGPQRGKISCMDQQLFIGGEPLPVR